MYVNLSVLDLEILDARELNIEGWHNQDLRSYQYLHWFSRRKTSCWAWCGGYSGGACGQSEGGWCCLVTEFTSYQAVFFFELWYRMTISLNLFDWFVLFVHFIMGSWAPAGSRNCALGANHGYPAGRADELWRLQNVQLAKSNIRNQTDQAMPFSYLVLRGSATSLAGLHLFLNYGWISYLKTLQNKIHGSLSCPHKLLGCP